MLPALAVYNNIQKEYSRDIFDEQSADNNVIKYRCILHSFVLVISGAILIIEDIISVNIVLE